MVIDSHVHLKHGDAAGTEYSAAQIVRTMDAADIARSVVFAMSTTTQRSIEMAEDAVAQFPDRLIPYVYALPSYERPVYRELEEALSDRGFRGIKIHAGECSLAAYVIDPVLELAGRYGVPCLIDLLGSLGVAQSLADRFPETKIILAHLGHYQCQDAGLIDRFIRIAEGSSNVFLDVSGVVLLDMIKDAVVRVGSSRVIWGTDGPHKDPDTVTFASKELEKIQILGLTRKAEQDLLGGTVGKLLGLRDPCAT
ncbi:MAG: amidohydrolase [Armatimonadetes bacterium]|nr:amidohydrolase [Armatimonadota bacterium]